MGRIKSFISVGDVIKIVHMGTEKVVTVERFEVLPNHDTVRPTEFIILCKFAFKTGGVIEATSDRFTYVKHISYKDKRKRVKAIPPEVVVNDPAYCTYP